MRPRRRPCGLSPWALRASLNRLSHVLRAEGRPPPRQREQRAQLSSRREPSSSTAFALLIVRKSIAPARRGGVGARCPTRNASAQLILTSPTPPFLSTRGSLRAPTNIALPRGLPREIKGPATSSTSPAPKPAGGAQRNDSPSRPASRCWLLPTVPGNSHVLESLLRRAYPDRVPRQARPRVCSHDFVAMIFHMPTLRLSIATLKVGA